MSVREGPRRHGAAHPIRNTLLIGGAATLGGVAVATGTVAAGAIAAAAGLAFVGVAGVVGIKALARKTASTYRNVQQGRQDRRERRVANGGRRHGVGGKLLDAAAGNPGLLAITATAAGIGLATSTPFLLVAGAAVGTGILIRNLLRNRAEAQGIWRQPSTLSQAIQALRDRAEVREAARRSEAAPDTERARTPEREAAPERRAPATVVAAAEPPAAPAVPVSSEPSSQRRAVVRQRRINARTDSRRPGARRVTGRPVNRDAAVPAATLSTGNPTHVQAVGGAEIIQLADLRARREARNAAPVASTPEVTPVTTEAPSRVRPRTPAIPGPGLPHGRPGAPSRRSQVARVA